MRGLWEGVVSPTASRNLEIPPQNHEKSMISKRNQCFSLISWSELGPLKQVAADMLTAGQVAPQPQFEESANDRGSRSWEGSKIRSPQQSHTFEDPSFRGSVSCYCL